MNDRRGIAGQEGSLEPFAEGPVTDNLDMQQELAEQARRLGEQSDVSGQIPGECAAKSRLRLAIPQVSVHMGAVCVTVGFAYPGRTLDLPHERH
jgi:hypothetical protein